MTKQETLTQLFAMLTQANLADTEQAADWQRKEMCHQSDLYGFLHSAIEAIEPGAAEHWACTGETTATSRDMGRW